jgi:hypothetical protein
MSAVGSAIFKRISKRSTCGKMEQNMAINFAHYAQLQNPTLSQLKTTAIEFLNSLHSLTVIDVVQPELTKWRVITTLLHGNEPSGFIAVHHWLKMLATLNYNNATPATNVRIIICSIEAAQLLPIFSHRYLPNGEDINRCFGADSSNNYHCRAKLIEQLIHQVSPEAIIDLHNTSGKGPAFAVATAETMATKALSGLFSDTLILSHICIGALMEQTFSGVIVTIECGGSIDELAHQIAYEGIKKFCYLADLFKAKEADKVRVIYKPLRLKINSVIDLHFADINISRNVVVERNRLILKRDIEQHNFGITQAQTHLGMVMNDHVANFELIDENGHNQFAKFFSIVDNQLITLMNMYIFMATTKVEIAKSDCLFYVVAA